MYKLFLTFRYLSRRVLALVATLVLAVAVAALVLAPSIMSGFQEEFHKRLRGTLSDLSFWGAIPFSVPEDPELEAHLEGLPHVEAVAPYLENPALDKHLDKVDYCFIRGIDPFKEDKVSSLRKYFLSDKAAYLYGNDYERQDAETKADLELATSGMSDEADVDTIFKKLQAGDPEDPGVPTCVVGASYLKTWQLQIGDTIRLTTATNEGEVSEDQKFRVVGAFRSGHHQTDRRVIIMSIKSCQAFCKVPGRLTGYSLRLSDHTLAADTKEQLKRDIQRGVISDPEFQGFYVKTWKERNRNLLRAVAMEKLLIRLMTGLIVVCAAASIFLVLFMTVHSKVRELGILRAVGATRSGVLLLFVGQGFLIALIAMLLGLILGVVVGNELNPLADWIYRLTGWHPFPPDIYYLDRIPVKHNPVEMAQNLAATLLLGAVAAIVPGFLAAFKPPLRAIRYE